MSKSGGNKKGSRSVTPRTGVIVAAAAATATAAAASAWERTHRRVTSADLTEANMHVRRLSDLRHEKAMMAEIAEELEAEWGSFAYLGFENIDQMAAEAGRTIFVVVEESEAGLQARGIVQTTVADVHGDAELLEEAYPSFAALTSREAWKNARSGHGDTAVLLQITTLGPVDQRGGGLGSLLRNTVLNMLPKGVKYALTTTPIDGAQAESIDGEDPSTYTPAMRFHSRGGASPARVLLGYKTPDEGAPETVHGHDVMVMRYVRDEEGFWPAKRPPMRVRSVGPLQERVSRTGRRLRIRPRIALPAIHSPRLRRPHFHLPRVSGGTRVVKGIKKGAARLRRGKAPELGHEVETESAEA